MADYLAINEFPGTGAVMQVEINFAGNNPDIGSGTQPYFKVADVKAEFFIPATATVQGSTTPAELESINPNTFRTVAVVPVGTILRVYRETEDRYPIVNFQALQNVTEDDLDALSRQVVFLVEEAKDVGAGAEEQALQAIGFAVDATNTANTALATADAATATSDAALAVANAANAKATAAVVTADQAALDAALAEAHATNVETLAAAAALSAANAAALASTANSTANTAASTANAIAGTANTALSQANNAVVTANAALDVANGIAGTANAALITANDALVSASAAVSTADGIAATAASALSNSNTAISTANSAVSTANSAVSTANSASSAASAAQGTANTAVANAATAQALAATKAAKGANSDITSLSGITTALSIAQGGTGGTTADSARASLLVGGRNRFINGAGLVDQRGGVSLTGSSSGFHFDRWKAVNGNAGGTLTTARAGSPLNGVSKFWAKATTVGVATNLGASNYWSALMTGVEGLDMFDMLDGPITVSFWFLASMSGKYNFSMRTTAVPVNSFVQQFTAVANTPIKVVITVPAIPVSVAVGPSCAVTCMIGSVNSGTFMTGTVGAWQVGNYLCGPVTGVAAWPTTLNATVMATELQLEAGTSATPFERRPYALERVLCQRYYELVSGTSLTSRPAYTIYPFKVDKNSSPSLMLQSGSTFNANFGAFGTGGLRCPSDSLATGSADWVISADAEIF